MQFIWMNRNEIVYIHSAICIIQSMVHNKLENHTKLWKHPQTRYSSMCTQSFVQFSRKIFQITQKLENAQEVQLNLKFKRLKEKFFWWWFWLQWRIFHKMFAISRAMLLFSFTLCIEIQPNDLALKWMNNFNHKTILCAPYSRFIYPFRFVCLLHCNCLICRMDKRVSTIHHGDFCTGRCGFSMLMVPRNDWRIKPL